MSTALTGEFPPVDGWTVDDLDELPEDGHRRELIDGVLIMTPSPTNLHQSIAMKLGATLSDSCPANLDVTQGVEVRVNRRRSLTPDVLVTTEEAAIRTPSKFQPHEVVLVVEIVSPGSQTLDRLTKPALYADAGIPYYWRIETSDGVEVHTHRLEPVAGLYVATGVFTNTIDIEEPWPIQLSIGELLPRRYSRPS